MRLSAREVSPMVVVMQESVRPIRLRTGSLTFLMDAAEALDLATQLADAVTQINAEQRGEHHG